MGWKYEPPIVDPYGVFYHGTDAHFESFEDSFKGSNTGWGNTVHGFFFADKKENAQLFGDTIITAHLDIRMPIDLRLHGIFNNESQAALIWEILSGQKLENATALSTLYDEIGLGEVGEMRDCLNSERGHEMMIANGYDGVISSLGDDEVEYVVFRASQIEMIAIDRSLSKGRFR
ncbi:ADP-ribosyltransferase-containing protein [Pedobacter paludis]|uniref:ART-PolyVal-like domain-containing protein n=1 Tax=Pedobacter paludis TaxID=2203212 RepID=A0A317F431_9SPHI|nr:hypothetical protein [Pedobacter paludis]PWS32619.1 hypothetical protein DF947_05980 [Pedobacter paludis]